MRFHIVSGMPLGPSPVRFKAQPRQNGDGWFVRATWDSGRTADILNFATRNDAEQWIEHEAPAWLEKRRTGSHD
jgi:hypothetical protein